MTKRSDPPLLMCTLLLTVFLTSGCGTSPRPSTASSTPVPVSPSSDMIPGPTVLFPTLTTIPKPAPPSPTPVPEVRNITEPLLIDAEEGHIYASADVNGRPSSVVLSTTDGGLLAAYPYSGRLALDQKHHLLIDQGQAGIVVIDLTTGARYSEIKLPVSGEPAADLQVDPNGGIAYAFRENTVYALDVQAGTVTSTTLSVPFLECGEAQRDADITHSFYDPISNTLYISFLTWECTAFLRDTIVAYDASSMNELGQYDVDTDYQAIAFEGSLYGTSQNTRLAIHFFWAYRNEEAWFMESIGGHRLKPMGIVIDRKRGLLYESMWMDVHTVEGPSRQVRISSLATREMLSTVGIGTSLVKNARLAGHDSRTDNLYFLEDGKLAIVPTTSILPVDPVKP